MSSRGWQRLRAALLDPLPRVERATPSSAADSSAEERRNDAPGTEAPAGPSPTASPWRPWIVLAASFVCLSALWAYGRLPFFRSEIAPSLSGMDPVTVELLGYWYLAASSVVTRMLVPLALIWWVFRERASDWGYRVRDTGGLAKVYLLLLAVMLPVLFYASGQPDFQAKYPLYDYASTSLTVFLVYELSYVLVFLSGESFWRGFMIFGLAPRFGLYSLPIMAIPYAMIHFGKPFPEALGAILTGLVLGWLALKHRSFWLGVALHSSIGIVMDLLCLWRKGQLGGLFGL